MVKDEMGARDYMIDCIEGKAGCYEMQWHNQTTLALWELFQYVVLVSHYK